MAEKCGRFGKGPQNTGYIEREDGELVLVKHDESQQHAYVFPNRTLAEVEAEIAALESGQTYKFADKRIYPQIMGSRAEALQRMALLIIADLSPAPGFCSESVLQRFSPARRFGFLVGLFGLVDPGSAKERCSSRS